MIAATTNSTTATVLDHFTPPPPTTTTSTLSGALEEDEFYPKTLQEELNEILEAFYSCVTDEEIRMYQKFVESITQRQIAQGALQTGCIAPDFELQDQDGDMIRLYDIQGPIVVTFYRGKWCPHCNATIMRFQRELHKLQAKGATLIAISPMLPDGTQYLASKRNLEFSVCSDVGNVVAKQFNISFQVTPEYRDMFLQWGEDIPGHNGDESWEIPVPATYVIDSESKQIVWSFLDNDPGVRVEIEDLLDVIPSNNPTMADSSSLSEMLSSNDEDSSVSSSSPELMKKKLKKKNKTKKKRRSKTMMAATFQRLSFRSLFGRQKQDAPTFLGHYMCPTDDLTRPAADGNESHSSSLDAY